MYSLEVKPFVDKLFSKLAKKNPHQLRIINKKIQEIQKNPFHTYKFLRSPLHGFNRAHVDKHFVLIFRIHHALETLEIWYYGHHDDVYKGKFVLDK